jgi:hypothetical protein
MLLGNAAMAQKSGWPSAGYDLENTRQQKTERRIAPDTVAALLPAWVT